MLFPHQRILTVQAVIWKHPLDSFMNIHHLSLSLSLSLESVFQFDHDVSVVCMFVHTT